MNEVDKLGEQDYVEQDVQMDPKVGSKEKNDIREISNNEKNSIREIPNNSQSDSQVDISASNDLTETTDNESSCINIYKKEFIEFLAPLPSPVLKDKWSGKDIAINGESSLAAIMNLLQNSLDEGRQFDQNITNEKLSLLEKKTSFLEIDTKLHGRSDVSEEEDLESAADKAADFEKQNNQIKIQSGLPNQDRVWTDSKTLSLLKAYRKREAWSSFLEDHFGIGAAVAFSVGSELFLGLVEDDLQALSVSQAGTILAELKCSRIGRQLPRQFESRYDHRFLYGFKMALVHLRSKAQQSLPMNPHTVLEELAIYLSAQISRNYIEPALKEGICFSAEIMKESEDWVFDLFGDMEIETFLYSALILDQDHPYHFDHWKDFRFH